METPLLISREVFDAVQEQLASRAPKSAPRLVNGSNLLAGIATCAHCGSGMTLRTGKSYRYYACAGRTQKDPTRCAGCNGPKATLALACRRGLPDTRDGVITFVRGWRPVGDSNPCYCRERGAKPVPKRSALILEIHNPLKYRPVVSRIVPFRYAV